MKELLSQIVRAANIREAPQNRVVTADAAQRAALAAAFGLPAIAALRGDFALRHERAGIIGAALRLQARLTQICVVTLEPFEASLDEAVALRFVPASQMPEAEAADLDAAALEAPDEIPYTGEQIDLGAALAEQLALSLDPYPRKPGAALPEATDGAAAGPFAMLRRRDTGTAGGV